LYAGVGVVSMLAGGEYLNYNVLAADPITGQHIGIILVEFGVGLTVTAVIMLMFFTFAARGEPEEDAS
jgi:multicomponent Na+:H+ antiporter subunit B